MTEKHEKNHRFQLRLHYFLAFILTLHSLFFIVYWIAVGRFRGVVDKFVSDAIGLQLPYVTIVMVLVGIICFWSMIRLIRLRLALRKGTWTSSWVNWAYAVIWVLSIAGIYAAFAVILIQDPSQKGVLIHLLSLTRLVADAVIFLVVAIWLRRLIVALRRKMQNTKGKKWPWGVGIALVLMSVVALWLVPAAFPPNWAYQGDLPTRPALIAHRGASMLAPENTLAAAELSHENQALGFETDVRISLDGVPFLMHDETLARTTNIAEVFPDRVNDPASSFTMDELKQLNAGLWFIQTDPYGTINEGLVSQSQLGTNQGQGIPTLAEALAYIEESGMIVLFDMRYPSEEHPFYEEFIDIVLTTCRESGLNGDVWFLVDSEHVEKVVEEAPQMTRVVGVSSSDLPNAQTLVDLQFEIVNVDPGIGAREIRAYRNQGLGVNVYTIDEPWLFSQYWLSGVTSVTTNNVHTLSQLNKPFLNVPYSRYLLFWGLYGIIVAIWLASSQPVAEPEEPRKMETPDLLDFATNGEDTVDTTQPAPAGESVAQDFNPDSAVDNPVPATGEEEPVKSDTKNEEEPAVDDQAGDHDDPEEENREA